DVGRSGVRIYDIASGAVLRSVDLPVDGRHHVLNDLALAPDGTAYLSDNQTGDLFRLGPRDTNLEKVSTGMQLLSPQGIVSSDDGSSLYVADYSIGLVRIDLAGESGEALSPIERTSLLGIDGLVRHGHDLIAIQNGVRPHRVLRIELSDDGRTITDVSVLEAAHPEYDEPTLGVLVDDDLYYIANSQWGSLAEDGSVSSGYPVHEPIVLRLPL
ncbi:MAG: hypothetical protein KC729_16175, partial [Candidatus Eisenbacteria bacterium]|nr:hypothetical protein [Candidatus Eisenbacteria bacterium]